MYRRSLGCTWKMLKACFNPHGSVKPGPHLGNGMASIHVSYVDALLHGRRGCWAKATRRFQVGGFGGDRRCLRKLVRRSPRTPDNGRQVALR